MDTLGNGGKGISWNTQTEVDFLKQLNYTQPDGAAAGRPKIETAIDAAEVILSLAPETNGQVAVKAWQALSNITGRDHTHLALNKEDEKSASAIFRRSRARLSLAQRGLVWKTNMSLITLATPTFMS